MTAVSSSRGMVLVHSLVLVWCCMISCLSLTAAVETLDDVSFSDTTISMLIETAREEYNESESSQDEQQVSRDGLTFPSELIPPYRDVIRADLAPWLKQGISKELLDGASGQGVKYQIVDGRLYRQKECMFPARCKGIEHFLFELMEDGLQDLEVIINVWDNPRIYRTRGSPAPPLLSFSKTDQFLDIMYPAWTFWAGGPAVRPIYPSGLGRWDQYRQLLIEKAQEFPWEKKDKVAYFRGSRTSAERDPLILLSRTEPDLVDASYTKNQAWKSDADTLGEPAVEPVPLVDHCSFAFLFNFRGVAASFRFKHLFLCNSLVFHVGEEWQEFFYRALRPWVHYVPVTYGMKEVPQLLEYFKQNEDEAKRIAKAGRDFVLNHLRMEDITLYWKALLENYASLLRFEVKRDSSLLEISEPVAKDRFEL